MLYIIAVAIGLILGLLLKGSISNLVNLKLEKIWIVILAFVIQIAGQIFAAKGFTLFDGQGIVLQVVVYCMLLTWFWMNRHYLGILVIGAGCLMNALVIMANGGRMPVDEALVKALISDNELIRQLADDGKHIIAGKGIKLRFLADIIHPPYFFSWGMQVVSIGDLVVAAGLLITVFELVRNKRIIPVSGGKKTDM